MNGIKEPLPRLGYFLRTIPTSATTKSTLSDVYREGLYPAFSASGQDVWSEKFDHDGPAIILSAVGAQCGKTFLAEGKWTGIANTVGFKLKAKCHQRYFWYLTNSEFFWEKGGSAQPYVKVPDTLRKRCHIPDPETQESIAAFLDRETASIDLLVEKKQRQVELLHRRAKQAVANLVIGVGKAGPKVSTGLDYMPSIPAHWKIMRAGNLFHQMAEPNNDDLPILSVSINTGISDRQLDDEERDRKVTLIEDRSSYKRVRPGYLAYNMMRAWQGAVGVSTVHGAVSPAYVVAKPTYHQHSPYFQFLLRTPPFIEQMRRGSKGITDFRLRLYWEQFRLIQLPVPPLDEQREIAIEAEREFGHAEHASARIGSSLELLKERRAALIDSAVTGQIDLTTWTKRDRSESELDGIEARLSGKGARV